VKRMACKRILATAILQLLVACGSPPVPDTQPSMHISFLTREGCASTPVMLERIKAALTATGIRASMTVVDVGSLEVDDPLTGYGTPTVLVGGFDLFGVPLPKPAPPI